LERQLWAESGKPEARFGAKEHAARDDLMESSDPSHDMEHHSRIFKVKSRFPFGEQLNAAAIATSAEFFPQAAPLPMMSAGILDRVLYVPTE
jgi:hypothetical protein